MLIKILRILNKSKIIFSNPSNVDLLIFDDESFFNIKNLVSTYEYSVLQTRPENINKLYVTIKIIFLTFLFFRGNLLSSYLIALIKIIKPKVVLTYIDNSLKFSEVAFRFQKIDKDVKFIALQNGARYEILENEYLFKKKINRFNINRKLFIPLLLSFGLYEKKIFKKLNVQVKKIIPVGNLKLESYIHFKRKIKIKKKRQICLLSDHGAWHPKMNMADRLLEKKFVLLTEFCIKFAKKHNYKIIICQKRLNQKNNSIPFKESDFFREREAYKKYLIKNHLEFLKKNLKKRDKNEFSTYLTMEQSDVTVSTMSTMLRENLYLRNKIFAANLTGNAVYNFPINEFFSVNTNKYQKFETCLLSILKMSKSNYFKKAGKNVDNCILNIENSTNKIRSILNKYM